MAQLVLTDASITINSVDLSDRANSVELMYEIDSVEVTAFGSGGHTFAGGLQNLSCTVEFMQDFATSEVEDTIYALVGTNTSVVIQPTSGAVSATNPSYAFTGFLASHTPVAGAVGELAMTSLTFTGGTLVKTTS
tara:strand:- start:442 stop:846 length:405 start_codon:yes stop_codon:yes gene_type:complete